MTTYSMTYDERVVTVYTGVPTLPADTDVTTGKTEDVDFTTTWKRYRKTVYEGGDELLEETISKEYTRYLREYRQIYTHNAIVDVTVNTDTPAPGQTETITTWRDGDWLRAIWDWRTDTQDTITRRIEDGSFLYVYEIGTGEATLDALLDEATVTDEESEYFPYMPIRLKNVFLDDPIYGDPPGGSGLYELTNRAYRRASGGGQRFSRLLDEVKDNASIDDIDYAFTHHGVGLNVLEPACRKYMYTWFKNISDYQNTTSAYIAAYQAEVAVYLAEVAAKNSWTFDQGDSGRPGYGDPPPVQPKLDDIKTTTVKLKCASAELKNLDNRVTWVNITETLHTGQARVGVEDDEIFWEGYPVSDPAGSDDFTWDVETGVPPKTGPQGYSGNVRVQTFSIDKETLYWQTGPNNYKKLTIWGLLHRNLVYGGESVDITGAEALASTDPTGFIIPYHGPSVKDLGIVDATQMATANTFIIFNTFEIVKQRWYEGFVGMIIIIIVMIILVCIFPPAGAGAGGLLGTNAAVGAAMGLTGTAAIVAGAVVNALVAIALSQLITFGSTELFGDKFGPIIAAVINLIISFGASGGFEVDNIGELMTASNLLKITSAIANGYEGYTQGVIAEIGDEIVEDQEKFEAEMKDIKKLLDDLSGNDLNFNPLSLTDSVKGNDLRDKPGSGYVVETLDQFIHRTTMTGSDIVDVTLSLVGNFAGLSLELP